MAAMMPLHLISGRLVISNVHGHVAISTPQCCHSGVEKKKQTGNLGGAGKQPRYLSDTTTSHMSR